MNATIRGSGTWIFADKSTRDEAGDVFDWREIGAMQVKGRKHYVSVFELRNAAETASAPTESAASPA